jgi:hypothetical protein
LKETPSIPLVRRKEFGIFLHLSIEALQS